MQILAPLPLLMLLAICWSSCHGLASVSRPKRQQRSAQQHQQLHQKPTPILDQKDGDSLERLWGLAGHTSRRKRQRGKKPSRDLREDVVSTTSPPEQQATTTIASRTSHGAANNFAITTMDTTPPRAGLQKEEIASVKVVTPSLSTAESDEESNLFLVDVTLVNGTTQRGINPQALHQRYDNALWMAIRQSLNVTASEFSSVANHSVFTTREKLLDIKAGLVERSSLAINSKACDWGLKMEPKALRQYCQVTGNTVQETGLHICQVPLFDDNDDKQVILLGASPDGLVVQEQTNSRGVLEIKSLWGRRHKTSLPQFDHCPQRFYDQIQGQLAICDLEWCDLMLYIPPNNNNNNAKKQKKGKRVIGLGSGQNYCILRVERDRSYWETSLLPEIRSFCQQVHELRLQKASSLLEAAAATTTSDE